GHYAVGTSFAGAGVDNAPLHALQDGVDGGNGVYVVGSGGTYPTSTFQGSNYLVDVAFTTTVGPDTTAPTISSTVPATNASAVAVAIDVTATVSAAVNRVTR